VVGLCLDGTETLGVTTDEEFLVMAYGLRVSWFPKFSYCVTFHRNIVSEFGTLSELRWEGGNSPTEILCSRYL
jgi:hypothetical protein